MVMIIRIHGSAGGNLNARREEGGKIFQSVFHFADLEISSGHGDDQCSAAVEMFHSAEERRFEHPFERDGTAVQTVFLRSSAASEGTGVGGFFQRGGDFRVSRPDQLFAAEEFCDTENGGGEFKSGFFKSGFDFGIRRKSGEEQIVRQSDQHFDDIAEIIKALLGVAAFGIGFEGKRSGEHEYRGDGKASYDAGDSTNPSGGGSAAESAGDNDEVMTGDFLSQFGPVAGESPFAFHGIASAAQSASGGPVGFGLENLSGFAAGSGIFVGFQQES